MAHPPEAFPRLLLVEPDPKARSALSFVLEALGYRVVTAPNGPDALALLRRSVDHPGLILLNVTEAWDFRTAQRRDPVAAALPVVVFAPVDCPRARGYSLDAVSYLRYPLRHRDLLLIMGRYCPRGTDVARPCEPYRRDRSTRPREPANTTAEPEVAACSHRHLHLKSS